MMWDYLARLMEGGLAILIVLFALGCVLAAIVIVALVIYALRWLVSIDREQAQQARKRIEVAEWERVYAMEWEESE